jgi:hypothetical protein
MLSGRASRMMIRIRIPPFRLIQIEFFTFNAETFLQIKRQIVFMVLLWFYYGFSMVFYGVLKNGKFSKNRIRFFCNPGSATPENNDDPNKRTRPFNIFKLLLESQSFAWLV